MEYRIASEKDIEQLIQSRMDTLRDVNHLDVGYEFSDEFRNASRAYFLEGDQTTVLATDGDMTAGCATMCYLQLMPTYSHPSGKRAHLMNVHTVPALRRKGIAARMVSILIEVAWSRGRVDTLNKAFGCEVAQPEEKPTNGEFIALIADKLSMERTA